MMDNYEFRALYDAYYSDVMRFIRALVRTESDVEEIAQDVFVRVARHYENYRSQAQLKTWILAITKNAVKDHWRREKRLHKKDTVDLEQVSDTFWATPASDEPSEQLSKNEERIQIRRCIDTLPQSMRLVLLCRAIEELSVQETADILGWSSARVRVTHMRALKKFHEAWQTQSTKAALDPMCATGPGGVAR